MEKNIKISEILKDKPVGLKFYSTTFGYISFNGVHKDKIYFFSEDTNAHSVKQNGKMYDGGECIIFPSMEMRDWSKFAWKKGDVLTDNISTICMFDGWANSDYTEFKAKYTLHLIASTNAENEVCKTNNFVHVLKEEDKQSYLATAETYFHVNITKGSLEIEQPKQEFKDGDIVALVVRKCTHIAIFKSRQETYIGFHAVLCNNEQLLLEEPFREDDGDIELRLATDSEKQQLFDALAEEGKAWDSDKKQIVDLPKKCEFKPFDKVLCRNSKDDTWEADFFARLTRKEIDYIKSDKYLCVGQLWMYCIPYNEETAHLLGTTDEWKGGEG